MDCQMEIINTSLMKTEWDCNFLAILDYVPKMIKSWWFLWGSLCIATEQHRVLTVNGLQKCQPSYVTFIRIISTFSEVMYLRLYLYELSLSCGGAEDVQPSGHDKISAINISATPQICPYEAMCHIDIGTQCVISHPHYTFVTGLQWPKVVETVMELPALFVVIKPDVYNQTSQLEIRYFWRDVLAISSYVSGNKTWCFSNTI